MELDCFYGDSSLSPRIPHDACQQPEVVSPVPDLIDLAWWNGRPLLVLPKSVKLCAKEKNTTRPDISYYPFIPDDAWINKRQQSSNNMASMRVNRVYQAINEMICPECCMRNVCLKYFIDAGEMFIATVSINPLMFSCSLLKL